MNDKTGSLFNDDVLNLSEPLSRTVEIKTRSSTFSIYN